MIAIQFLGEWALRSSLFVLTGALLLRVLRVKNPSIRLTAWTAMLFGSLLIPILSVRAPRIETPILIQSAALPVFEIHQTVATAATPFDWSRLAFGVYLLVAIVLLLRLCVGLTLSARLKRRSRAVDTFDFRESDEIAAPVALGILRPIIVLPADWRDWDEAKLHAVLAHERSHIRRCDPAMQLLSALHRAVVWHSPLSWVLHRGIVRTAEEVSDDDAVATAPDRASYAEALLSFMQRGRSDRYGQGVAMARYVRPEHRIHRILDGTALTRGVTRWGVTAIVLLGAPLAYFAASADPQRTPETQVNDQYAPPAPPAPPARAAMPAPPAPPVPPPAGSVDAPQPPDPPNPPDPPDPPPAPPRPPQAKASLNYVIADDDNTTSGSWNSNDGSDPTTLRAKYGNHFAYFRKDGKAYLITDPVVMAQFKDAMQPQAEVNGEQNKVNAEQSRVNALQSGVNSRQGDVNALQGRVNRHDSSVTQDEVNHQQSLVNHEQSTVNAEQSKVNAMQGKVNEQQSRVSAEYGRAIMDIFDSTINRGLAHQVNESGVR